MMLEADVPAWIRWIVGVAQVVGPIATIVLAVNAFRTAKAALVSAEVAKRQFELSRMPAIFLQNLQATHRSGDLLLVRGMLDVETDGTSPTERVGRRAVLHKVITDVEVFGAIDEGMPVVGRGRRTLPTKKYMYGNQQLVAVTARLSGVASVVELRVSYTFSGTYATRYVETWMATASAETDEDGQFDFKPVSHNSVGSQHYEEDSYPQRLRKWLEKIRREMGG